MKRIHRSLRFTLIGLTIALANAMTGCGQRSSAPQAGTVTAPAVEPNAKVALNDQGQATLQSDRVRAVFSPTGGKCISLQARTDGGWVELTDATGIFEDHLAGQSYLKSDFRRANFALKPDGKKLLLSADALSPEWAGLKMTKEVRFVAPGRMRQTITLENTSAKALDVALWHHQALHTKDGSTRYFLPTENGIQTLSYDPKAAAAETTVNNPSRPWLAMAAGTDKSAVAAAFIPDWTTLQQTYNYRSDLYATLEWRSVSDQLLPGQKRQSSYDLLIAPGAGAVAGVLGDALIDPAAKPIRLVGGRLAGGQVLARKADERLLVPAGKIDGPTVQVQWPAGYSADDSVLRVSSGEESAEFSPAGKPFTMEPQPGRLAAAKVLPKGRQDMLYSLDVPMPHTPWAKPYYRGSLKTWILSPIVPNGDTVSLLKRFDFDYDIVSCDMSWEMNTWGMGDTYGRRSNKQSMGRAQEFGYATEDLTSDKHYDLMILPTVIGWNVYPPKMRQAIVQRVKDGAGLLLIAPQNAKQEQQNPNGPDQIALPVLSPMSGATDIQYHWYGDWERHMNIQGPGKWTIKQPSHSIVRGVCWEEMPLETAVQVQDFTKVADDAVLITSLGQTPTIAVKPFGKGRVAAINWHTGRHNASLSPGEDESKSPSWDYWEQFYNLLGRAGLWAAGREPEIDVKFGSPGQGIPAVEIDNRLRDLEATLHLIVKDERGRVVSEKDLPVQLARGTTHHQLPAGDLPGGTNHLEVIVRSGPYSLAWGATQVATPKTAEVTAVTISPDAVKNGQTVKGEVSVKGNKIDGTLRTELRDPFGRILARKDEPLKLDGEKTLAYSFKVENPVSLVVFVRAQAILSDRPASEKDSPEAVITPDEPKFSDYEVIPWGFSARRNLWDVKAAQYRTFFVTGNSAATPETLRAGFITKGHAEPERRTLGIYWYDDERERLVKTWEQYKQSGDKTILTRNICLSDPEVLKKVEQTVRDKVEKQRKYNPGTYYIGDESSVSAYSMEMDLDFNPKSLEAFRAWLKERYGSIEKLNTKWQTDFADFDAIVPFTIIEVEKDPRKATGWAEFRTFMEIQYENVLKLIRTTGKAADPNAEFELTGTQSATSFDGIDWARHTRHVKRFVPYNINFAYDQLRCFNPGVKMAALTGYGSRGDGVKLSLWNQAFHGLLSANIFWEWSVVDPDFTLSQNAQDIGTVFAELRGKGIGRLLNQTTWVKSPVAIYYSQPSIHAARVMKKESVCHDSRNAWCQIVRDLGLQFDMLSYFQVEEGSFLKDPPQIMILSAAFAVSPLEAQQLTKYVENGGTLVADLAPGVADDRCDFRENKLLANLFGDGSQPGVKTVGKGKAILLGKNYPGYAKARDTKAGVEARLEAAKLMADNGVKPTVPVQVDNRPLSHAETVVMQHGNLRLLGILKENLRGIRRTTEDGVEYFEPLPPGAIQPAEQIHATLPKAYHVYNVRSGKYLGQTNTISDTLEPAEAKLYALLPYPVKALKLQTSGKFEPGKSITVQASLDTGGAAADDHVFNVRVLDARGNELPYLSRNLPAPKGQASFVLPVELNPAGPFKLLVTDVSTGVQQSHEFK